jgi:nickel/cobalt transporter (NicO) family protein
MKLAIQGRKPRSFTTLAVVIAMIVLATALLDHAYAQGSPFGGPRPGAAPVPVGGIVGWLFAKQAEFYRQFSALIRASRADGSALWSLVGVSFLYGIFHAAGPGHGKAVITSYLIANEETWVRGVSLSLLSALLQALVAIGIVAVAAALLHATAATMTGAINLIETVGYVLIILIGVRLLWVKGRALLAAWRELGRPKGAVGAADTPVPHYPSGHHEPDAHGCRDHAHHADHDHCGHDANREDAHDHVHADHCHDHDHAFAWGHSHAPEPAELAGPGGWQRGLSAIVAVGLRPCSGAILVLVFALVQGLFWVGVGSALAMALGTFITVAGIASLAVGARSRAARIASGRSGYGALAMRGIEVAAALLIMCFGVLLLTGYMIDERMIGL